MIGIEGTQLDIGYNKFGNSWRTLVMGNTVSAAHMAAAQLAGSENTISSATLVHTHLFAGSPPAECPMHKKVG